MSRVLNVASALIVIVGLIGVVYALQSLFLSPVDEGLLGVTVSEIRAFNPNVMDFLTLIYRFSGLYMFGVTLSSITIAMLPYRKAQKWAWFYELIVGGLALIGQLAIVYIGAALLPSYFLPFNAVLVVLWIVGLILPAEEFFT